MKNVFMLIAFAMIVAISTSTAQSADALNTQVETPNVKQAIKWDKTTFDFGDIPQGKPAKATFKITNMSDAPLLIKEVKPTCGCTVAAYDQEPILPGESTEISATYNAKKEGIFRKRIKVLTSLNEELIPLMLKGEVIKP